MLALLSLHYHVDEKCLDDLEYFYVDKTLNYGKPCFWIATGSGRRIDFSYLRCIDGPPKKFEYLTKAFRRIVQQFMIDYRKQYIKEHANASGMIVCAETGEWIAPEDGDMDHRYPLTFQRLILAFLDARGMCWEDVAIAQSTDSNPLPVVSDPALRSAFYHYHLQNAVLEMVKGSVNKGLSAINRIRRPK